MLKNQPKPKTGGGFRSNAEALLLTKSLRVQKFKSSRAQTLKPLEHLEPLKPFKNQSFINQLNQRKEKHYGKTHRYFT